MIFYSCPYGGNVNSKILTSIIKRLSNADKRFFSDRYKKMFILDVIVKLALAAAHVVDVYNVVKSAVFVDILKHIPQSFQFFGCKMQSFAVIENSCVEYLRLHQVLKDMTAVGELGVVACTGFLHFADDVKFAYIGKCCRYAKLG